MTAPHDDRLHALLTAALAAQRRHVLGIVEDLDDESLRRVVLPSGWTCAALVQHLALDVERFWFNAVMAGDPETIAFYADSPDGWQVDATASPKDVLDLYRSTIAAADAVIGRTSLQDAPAWWPQEQFGDWRMHDLAQLLVHVITETSCHAGHLDAARELIDGRQWFVVEE